MPVVTVNGVRGFWVQTESIRGKHLECQALLDELLQLCDPDHSSLKQHLKTQRDVLDQWVRGWESAAAEHSKPDLETFFTDAVAMAKYSPAQGLDDMISALHTFRSSLDRPRFEIAGVDVLCSESPKAPATRHVSGDNTSLMQASATNESLFNAFKDFDRSVRSPRSVQLAPIGYQRDDRLANGGGPDVRQFNCSRPEPPLDPTAVSDYGPKLTKTGRASKAGKGQPVHVCGVCDKIYTRAEHLRRHQVNHNAPELKCPQPGCERAFRRTDLLERHRREHNNNSNKRDGALA